ncbi:hypothetical protein EOD39_16695 [Acipenser ruthenus]|uniref:Uncharacterized protein n=1 Tax=Acipenser ruthenus TaxID=7906 RepID=A0A444V583_ACIRT|nr:hypothetical protein EOD39_16695 [Acipenser ruthenus]
MPGSECDERKVQPWDAEEVQALISLWGDRSVQEDVVSIQPIRGVRSAHQRRPFSPSEETVQPIRGVRSAHQRRPFSPSEEAVQPIRRGCSAHQRRPFSPSEEAVQPIRGGRPA